MSGNSWLKWSIMWYRFLWRPSSAHLFWQKWNCRQVMLNSHWSFERPTKALFRFFSNSAINTGRGFRARWEIGCGGFFDKPGKISSPYFPNPFPIQKSCSYLIQAPKDDFVSLGRVSGRYFQPIEIAKYLTESPISISSLPLVIVNVSQEMPKT